jgi:hypothetical protein
MCPPSPLGPVRRRRLEPSCRAVEDALRWTVASFALDRHELALRAVVRLRPVLDDLEARLVFDCSRYGLTWAEIGEILGVSRDGDATPPARHLACAKAAAQTLKRMFRTSPSSTT